MEGKKIFLVFFAVVLFSSIALAAHVVLDGADDNTSFGTVVEDTTTFYNISINNTDLAGTANITEVNVTLPSGFTFASGTNSTSVGTHTFTSPTGVLRWYNAAGLILNGTVESFQFNATAATPGNYNFSVTTTNASGQSISNISVIINDTTAPALTFITPTPSNGSSFAGSSIAINVSATDATAVDTIVIYLFNSTVALRNSSTFNSTAQPLMNISGVSDGTYYYNATANDTIGNLNASVLRTIIIDTAAPTVTFSCSPTSVSISSTVTCSCTASDAIDSDVSLSFTANPSTSSTGTFSTTCTGTDDAGNAASASASYTVTSSGGSSGGGSTPTWSLTYLHTGEDFSEIGSVTRSLEERERISIEIDDAMHHVGIINNGINGDSVTIEVSSDPQQATLNEGSSQQFDIDSDGYADIEVSIGTVASQSAEVTVAYVYEQVALAPEESAEATTIDEEPTSASDTVEDSSSGWGMFVALIVLVIVGVAGWFYWRSRQSRPPHSRK